MQSGLFLRQRLSLPKLAKIGKETFPHDIAGLQRDGLDVELMQRIDETLERISHAPRRYPRVHQQLRRAIVRQFPFAICG